MVFVFVRRTDHLFGDAAEEKFYRCETFISEEKVGADGEKDCRKYFVKCAQFLSNKKNGENAARNLSPKVIHI